MGLRSWFFGKKIPPQRPVDDWQVGDLGECIEDDWAYFWPCNPRCGDLVRVAQVYSVGGGRFLRLVGKPPIYGWAAKGFRKITPKNEECAQEFREWLKNKISQPDTAGTTQYSSPRPGSIA